MYPLSQVKRRFAIYLEKRELAKWSLLTYCRGSWCWLVFVCLLEISGLLISV